MYQRLAWRSSKHLTRSNRSRSIALASSHIRGTPSLTSLSELGSSRNDASSINSSTRLDDVSHLANTFRHWSAETTCAARYWSAKKGLFFFHEPYRRNGGLSALSFHSSAAILDGAVSAPRQSNVRCHDDPRMLMNNKLSQQRCITKDKSWSYFMNQKGKTRLLSWQFELESSRPSLIMIDCNRSNLNLPLHTFPILFMRPFSQSSNSDTTSRDNDTQFSRAPTSQTQLPHPSTSPTTQPSTALPTSPPESKQPSEPVPPSFFSALTTSLPPSLQPYARLARLDKPIGTMLLLHPCLWSTALSVQPVGAFPSMQTAQLCAMFATGAFFMRGAGCTINDMWDARFDGMVDRTRDRPLASGQLSYHQAWRFLALQLTMGLGVLVSLPHVESCVKWGVASLPLVAIYPAMKRFTDYPQMVLGLTFNWGAIMGCVAVRGEVDPSVVVPLYLSGVMWTLVYDTLYAHQDKWDDAKLGLKSTALTFGDHGTKPILTALSLGVWGAWMTTGYNVGFDTPFYYVGCSLAASHLLWQVWSADLNHVDGLAKRFRSNNYVGWMVFGSSVAGHLAAS